ncbi:MAG: molybdopterin-dependent oxidoreductase, partial [Candidatus Dormibacteraeota bacterium]|nr:molybdopterin-dependent oxidoreductase [Candidatus Dormibacteraeota bacterium]
FDGGAYAATKIGPGVLPGGVFQGMAPYRVPHVRMEARAVYTNSVPGGIMRSPGELQGVWAAESHVDMMARELGLDPIEFRLRNVTRDGDTDVSGSRVHVPQGAAVLERLRAELATSTPAPSQEGVRYGRGVGLGTRHVGDGRSQMRITLLPEARVQVEVGLPDQGSGSHTVAQRVVAAALGVSLQRVSVKYASTLDGVYDAGAGGSKSTHSIGAVAMQTGGELKDRLQQLAAEVMGWPADAIELSGDRFTAGSESASFDEVAERISRGARVQVEGTHTPEPAHAEGIGDANYTAFGIAVEVDPDTGEVRIVDVLQVADVGTIINPVAHEGQLRGGFGFGLGAAMMEDLATQDGRVLTPSLGEYKLPTQMDMPPYRLVHVQSVGPGPFGAKMAGELSNCAVAPAVANAIADAVGVRLTDLPITAEAVLRGLSGR